MSLLTYGELLLIYQSPGAEVSIFRACHQSTQTPVIIKQLRCSSLAQANAAIAESLTQARLSHPHICQVYECFLREEGEGFVAVLVVEMMESDLFKEITRRKETQENWSEREVVEHLGDMAGALAYAEAQGVAHRDLKPQNMFVTREGRVKIGDFGSASFSFESNLRTTLQGSPFFLSPELKRAYLNSLIGVTDTNSYNPYSSDVYSLGLTVLYMALLEAPAALAIIERLETHTVETLEGLAQWPTLQYILYYMLSVEPAQRPSFQYITDYCGTQLGKDQAPPADTDTGYHSISLPAVPHCSACNCPLSSGFSWRDDLDSELRAYADQMTVCSKACFLSAASGQSLNPNACLLDSKLLRQANNIRLECGHGFCSQGCLSKYLVNGSKDEESNITLTCKICKEQYGEDKLRAFYKGVNLYSMIRSGRSSPKCQHCNHCCMDTTLACGHNVSLQCATLLQPSTGPARMICPVCSKSKAWS